jgi:tetratricopeptide (TPR) repeat protein
MSQTALGQQVGLTGAWVSAVERGERSAGADRLSVLVPLLLALRVNLRQFLTAPVPGVAPFPVEWLAQVDEALGIGATNAGMAPIARMLGGAEPDVVVLAKDRQGAWYVLHRREAIRRGLEVMGVASIGAFTLDRDQTRAVTHAVDTQRANTEAVGAYRGLLDALRRADDQVGSTSGLREAAEIHLDTLKGWLANADPGAFDNLAKLTVEYAGSCGWMHYDAGNLRRAVMVYRDALPIAQALGDRPLAAHLTRLTARAQLDMGDIGAARQSTERAVALVASLPAWRVRAYAEGQRAELYARLGDRDASLATLGQAEEALGETDGIDTPYAYWVKDVDEWRGRSLTHLGEHDDAREVLARRVRTTPASYVRDRAVFLTDLAEGRVAAKDVVAATDAAKEAAEVLGSTSSGREVRRLRILHGRLAVMAKGAEVAGVKELGEQVRSL